MRGCCLSNEAGGERKAQKSEKPNETVKLSVGMMSRRACGDVAGVYKHVMIFEA